MPTIPDIKVATNAASSVGPLNFGSVYGGQIGMVQTPSEVELAYLNAGKQAPASQGIPRWAYIAIPVILVVLAIAGIYKWVKG